MIPKRTYLKITINEDIFTYIINKSLLGEYFETSKSIIIPSETNEMLLLFIRIIGCLDILFLSAYLAVCIYDRTGHESTTDFAPPDSNLPQHSTMYENIDPFTVSGSN